MSDTFTKFDHLGSVLAEISYDTVSLQMMRRTDGEVWFYLARVHQSRVSYSGNGDTPSAALAGALEAARLATIAAVEAASGQEAA